MKHVCIEQNDDGSFQLEVRMPPKKKKDEMEYMEPKSYGAKDTNEMLKKVGKIFGKNSLEKFMGE